MGEHRAPRSGRSHFVIQGPHIALAHKQARLLRRLPNCGHLIIFGKRGRGTRDIASNMFAGTAAEIIRVSAESDLPTAKTPDNTGAPLKCSTRRRATHRCKPVSTARSTTLG